MKTIAIIPARGGSKGIPRKNLLSFCGMPLIYWSIAVGRLCPMIDAVYVSTDDEEIGSLSRSFGAEVIERPPQLATDSASSESALIHACEYLQSKNIELPEKIVFLQATSPLREVTELSSALDQFDREGLDSLLSAASREHSFWWRAGCGSAEPLNYDFHNRPRRQDRGHEDSIILETGSYYITKTSILLTEQNRLGGKIGVHIVPLWKGMEIDDTHDVPLLEHLMRYFGVDKQLLAAKLG